MKWHEIWEFDSFEDRECEIHKDFNILFLAKYVDDEHCDLVLK